MKQFLKLLPLVVILILTIIFKQSITEFIIDKFIFTRQIYIQKPNEYAVNYDFQYVQTTDDFYAKDYQQLLNILYTALNNGNSYFYFFCEYEQCENDVDKLTESNQFVNINNYVHPYNSYRKLYVTINSLGKVSVTIDKSYDENDILAVNKEIEHIMDSILTENMSTKEKITTFHDYIIDNTKYDTEYINKNLNDIDNVSHKANGPLFYHKALCGGYADVMAVFLNKLKIPNYRISSESHIWNFVKLDNQWLHLDLTWDDPVTTNGQDIRQDTFLLITTEQLQNLKTGYHDFNHSIYLETN